MSTNGVNNSEDADMSECDGEKVVTMMDVLQEQEEFEEDANAVLGASDDKNCTYSMGYIKRQAIYACLTCCVDAGNDPLKRAGVCLACSLNCHENHELIELYTKRNFRCDCGNPKFNLHPCQFTPNKTDLNEDNSYNQNFSGLYCTCHRPYPDPESPVEDEMIQCIICEDWLHASHLEATVPANEQYSEMICKTCMNHNEFLHDYSNFVVNIDSRDLDVTTVNESDICTANVMASNDDLEADKLLNGAVESLSENSKVMEASNGMDIDMVEALELVEKGVNKKSDIADSKLLDVGTTEENKQVVTKESSIEKELGNEQPLNFQENIPNDNTKESTDLHIEAELDKTVEASFNTDIDSTENAKSEDISIRNEAYSDKINEPNDANVAINEKMKSEVSNCGDKNGIGSDDNKEIEKPEHSVADDSMEIISEDKVIDDFAKKVSTNDDISIANSTENAEDNLQVKEDTTSIEEETGIQQLPVHQQVGQMELADTQATETEQSIDGTELPVTGKNQDKLLEKTNEKNFENSELESRSENNSNVNAVSEENLVDADTVGKENIDETDIIETTSDKTEEQIFVVKQDESMQETTKESEVINDAKENIDTENKTNDNLTITEHNDSTESMNKKHFSEKTKCTDVDGITNKTENSDSETTDSNEINTLNNAEIESDVKINDNTSEAVPKDSDNNVYKVIECENKSNAITNDIAINSTNMTKLTNIENKVPTETVINAEDNTKEKKRKLSTEDAGDVFVKKSKFEDTKKCVRPQRVKKVFKGATFWPANFRQKLCTCSECISMYKDLAVLYLIDLEDTVLAYETLGKEKTSGGPASQYEKGLEALSSLDRIQQINALTEYNKMRDKLLDFLKSFKDRKEIVKEEDIKAFFAGMKPKREPDGVYFCR